MIVRAAWVIAVSAVVHGGVVLALGTIEPGRLLIRPAPPPALTLEVPPAAEPVAIEVIELPPAAAAAAPAPAAAAAPAAASAAGSGSGSAISGSLSTAHPERGPGGPESKGRAMGMRAPGESPGVDFSALTFSGAVLDEILSRPPRPDVPASGLLEQNRNSKGGRKDTYTGHDLTFTAKIDADGHVMGFEDKPNLRYKFHLPNPLALGRAAGERVAAWAEDPYDTGTHAGAPTIAKKSGEQKEPEGRVFTILSGGFDVTDAIMRWADQDPYDARKRAFLDSTFDERVQIGTVHRKKQLDRADTLILRHLDALWARGDLDLADKRELVFELWDECADAGGDSLQDGGDKARAALLRWIAVHLAAGGDAAFTDDELETFNARRRSKARFAPYD